MPDRDPQSLADVLSALAKRQHTGRIVLHLAQGRPRFVEIPGESVMVKLDKTERQGQDNRHST